jgi:hypothetical protein
MRPAVVLAALVLLIAVVAYASPSSSPPRDITVEIDGARYTCGLGSGDVVSGRGCASKVAGLRALVDACSKISTLTGCFDRHWESFRARYPSCALDAAPLCLQYCSKVWTGCEQRCGAGLFEGAP